MEKTVYVVRTLENEICDDSYVKINGVYTDMKKGEEALLIQYTDHRQMLLNEFDIEEEELDKVLSVSEDKDGIWEYRWEFDDKIIEIRLVETILYESGEK